jgi:hypothetical protein
MRRHPRPGTFLDEHGCPDEGEDFRRVNVEMKDGLVILGAHPACVRRPTAPTPPDGRKATADRLRAERNRAADRDGRRDVNSDHLTPMRRDRAEVKAHGRVLTDSERSAMERDAYRARVAREEAASTFRLMIENRKAMIADPFTAPERAKRAAEIRAVRASRVALGLPPSREAKPPAPTAPPARDSRITRRKVEAMPYGSIEQVEAADLHFSRLMAWDAKREDRWYADKAIRKLLMSDVWYLANRRWLDRRDAETVMEPDWNPTPPAPPAGATELSPPENVAAKLERIHNRTTKYEVTATRDGRTVLLGYTRKGRRGMDSLICSDDGRRDAIVKVLGTNRITYDKKASQGAVMGEWTIKFSGRTHRDCIIEGEWPFVMTIAESMGA